MEINATDKTERTRRIVSIISHNQSLTIDKKNQEMVMCVAKNWSRRLKFNGPTMLYDLFSWYE